MDNADARAKLIAKARSLILLGKGRFTVTQLAKETRVSMTTIRSYFPTKSNLISAILSEGIKSGPSARVPTELGNEHFSSSTIPTEIHEFITAGTICTSGATYFVDGSGNTTTSKRENPSTSKAKVTACLVQSTLSRPIQLEQHISSSGQRYEENKLSNAACAPVVLSGSKLEKDARADAGTLSMSESPGDRTMREHVSQPTAQSNHSLKTRMPTHLMIGVAAGFAIFMICACIIVLIPPAYARLTHSADGAGPMLHSTAADAHANFAENGLIRIRRIFDMAKKGDARAQVQLAQAFLRGDGVKADPATALRWSQIAAAQGEPTAQYILGELYAEGLKPNPDMAFHWFAAAASQGNVKAMHNLAIAFLNGQGVAKDADTAVYWFARAANSGYRDSAFDLAVLYERGQGVAQNPRVALRWYDVAAAHGDQQAAQQASFLRSQLPQLAEK
jgi:TPR repeat protein